MPNDVEIHPADLGLLYDGDDLYQPHEVAAPQALQLEGANQKGILVVFDNGTDQPLAPAEKEQVIKILGALKLTPDDVMMANAQQLYQYGFAGWLNHAPPFNKMIAFGASAMSMGLTLRLRRYAISNFQNTDLLFVDNVATIMQDTRLKAELWAVLQVMFGIKK